MCKKRCCSVAGIALLLSLVATVVEAIYAILSAKLMVDASGLQGIVRFLPLHVSISLGIWLTPLKINGWNLKLIQLERKTI